MSVRDDPTKSFIQHIFNQQVDDSVSPPALVLGVKGLNPSGGYTAIQVNAAGKLIIDASTLGSYTAGSVLFANASGYIAQNNTKLFWDNTNFRLGIGTDAPSTGLHSTVPALFEGVPTATVPTLKISSTSQGLGTEKLFEIYDTAYGASQVYYNSSEGMFMEAVQTASIVIYNAARTAVGAITFAGTTNKTYILPNLAGTSHTFVVLGGAQTLSGTKTLSAAVITLIAGTTTVPPLKFTSGTSLTTPQVGAVEFTTDDLFFTITTGTARKAFILDDGARLTSGRLPFATTNGRLVDNANLFWDNTNFRLGVNTPTPASTLDIAGGALATEGSNLVVNGGFDTDTNWTKGTGWTIDGVTAVKVAGTASDLSQTISGVVAGQMYNISWSEVRNAGSYQVQIGGVKSGSVFNGTPQTIATILTSAAGDLTFVADSAFDGTIDDVTCTLITPNTAGMTIRDSVQTIQSELRVDSLGNFSLGTGGGKYILTGSFNTAFGFNNLLSNTTGSYNVAIGYQALRLNTTGGQNIAFSSATLTKNTTGGDNIGIGAFVLTNSITSDGNIGIGTNALNANTTGQYNIVIGYAAGKFITTSKENIIIGWQAGDALLTGTGRNICIGYNVDLPTTTTVNTMTISNVLFGTGMTGTGTTIPAAGKIGIAVAGPTARLHLAAGATGATTAPLKFNTGTSMTTAEAGAVEFTTDDLFFTITTGAARKAFILDDGARLTSGRIPFAFTNGRLVDSSLFTFSTASGLTLSALNLITDTTTGMKIGTATTQKLGFWNTAPIVQPAGAGLLTGFTANASANATFNESTWTGNTGTKAYTISDIVKALKDSGLMAAS